MDNYKNNTIYVCYFEIEPVIFIKKLLKYIFNDIYILHNCIFIISYICYYWYLNNKILQDYDLNIKNRS